MRNFDNITNLRGNILIDQQVTWHFTILLPEPLHSELDCYCSFVFLFFANILVRVDLPLHSYFQSSDFIGGRARRIHSY